MALTNVQAHKTGMLAAVGSRLGLVTLAPSGSVTFWPEADLRLLAGSEGLDFGPVSESPLDVSRGLSKVRKWVDLTSQNPNQPNALDYFSHFCICCSLIFFP